MIYPRDAPRAFLPAVSSICLAIVLVSYLYSIYPHTFFVNSPSVPSSTPCEPEDERKGYAPANFCFRLSAQFEYFASLISFVIFSFSCSAL